MKIRFRRRPPRVPVSPEKRLTDAMAAYLYSQLGAGDLWIMSPEWLEVIDDLLGEPLPVRSGAHYILGYPVTVDRGRPRLTTARAASGRQPR